MYYVKRRKSLTDFNHDVYKDAHFYKSMVTPSCDVLVHKLLLLTRCWRPRSLLNTFYLVSQNGLISVAGPRSSAAHTFTYPRAKMPLVSSLNFLGFQVLWDLRRWFYIHSMIALMHMRFDEKAYLVKILTSSFWIGEVGIMVLLFHKIDTFNVFGGQETYVHWLKRSKVNTL